MILSYQTLKARGIMTPWYERSIWNSPIYGEMTFGAGPCSYDVRLDEVQPRASVDVIEPGKLWRLRPGGVALASTLEHFRIPHDVKGGVHDKSSWKRRFLSVGNTLLDPGWRGYLTLELTNESEGWLTLEHGAPMAQVSFELLDEPTHQPYNGKYQDQEQGPQEAR